MIVTFFFSDPHYSSTWADCNFAGNRYGVVAGDQWPLEPSMAYGFYEDKETMLADADRLRSEGHDVRVITERDELDRFQGVSHD